MILSQLLCQLQAGNVVIPQWIVYTFLFAMGCCIGSFLNVVIYRLPREKSIITPPSACPSCSRHIRFYDNIPLISWLLLGRKCRYCKAPISPRYFFIELLTGLVFLGVYILYFKAELRTSMVPFLNGGWLIYLISIVLLASFIVASAVDLELWVIPIAVCWLATVVGVLGSALAGYVIEPIIIRSHMLLPTTATFFIKEATVASVAAGAAIGLMISIFLLLTGLVKQSYENEETEDADSENTSNEADNFNHRREMFKEIVFLLPIISCVVVSLLLTRQVDAVRAFWLNLTQHSFMSGLMGSLFGYFVGCAVVWATRIFGTLGFGREAMGLGDVHLMGAAGAVVGPFFVIIAFFIAPFYGLVWAFFQMFFKKTRQIPYGPFLSLGVFTVMIMHDWFVRYIILMRYQ
ncbi:MAG: prepilin peptidase [Planctomycetota bacterium]|jgi:leader peptidase (prepilin peptidase)/N-methyltransferase